MADVFENVSPLTAEMVEEARAMIGEDLRIAQYNHEATYDTIRHYAHGLGDDNPLWCDRDYAKGTRYGDTVAPPTFFYSVFAPGIAPKFEGMQPFQAGGDCTWYRYARRGEAIHARARLTDVERKNGRTVSDLIIEHGETEYRTDGGELLAVFKSRSFRTPRPGAQGALQYKPQPRREYTPAELEQIEQDVLGEERRGATIRYWDDVEVGDKIPAVVKGPLGRMDMTCYYAGALATAGYRACEIRWRQRRMAIDQPENVPNNYDITYFREMGLPSVGHQDDAVAQAAGMPGAYDNGHQRIGWLAHAVTNWVGDDGFLQYLHTEIRRPNVFGNTVWISGEVTGKRIGADGTGEADFALRSVDQDGVVNAVGRGTARFLVRGNDR
jgi:acyl dehydratase